MTLPDLSALGLETSEAECAVIKRKASSDIVRYVESEQSRSEPGRRLALLRDIAKLITALSEARAYALEDAIIIGRLSSGAELQSLMRLNNDLVAREAAARKEERTRAAKIARGNLVDDRFVTWPCWNPYGNRWIEDDTAKLGAAIANAIEGNEEGMA